MSTFLIPGTCNAALHTTWLMVDNNNGLQQCCTTTGPQKKSRSRSNSTTTTNREYLVAIATLFRKQNPMALSDVAWWPGGRMMANPFFFLPTNVTIEMGKLCFQNKPQQLLTLSAPP